MDAAVIFVGGRGSRLGGVFKPGLVREGETLLVRTVRALLDSERILTEQRAAPGWGPIVLQGIAAVPADVRDLVETAARPAPRVLARADGASGASDLSSGALATPPRGPLAALRDAARLLPGAGRVLLLAGDLAAVTARDLAELRAPLARPTRLVTDPGGRDQYLFALWDAAALHDALAGLPPGAASLRALYARADERASIERMRCAEASTADIDEPSDAARWGISWHHD
ncbi:nucleotidyltransferase family protein [Micrococcales bacterium 31B]|nr:nucleotidyltransferase family protein [Micrococcales bacterium 31B]